MRSGSNGAMRIRGSRRQRIVVKLLTLLLAGCVLTAAVCGCAKRRENNGTATDGSPTDAVVGPGTVLVRQAEDAGEPEGGVLTFEGYRIYACNGGLVIEGGSEESTRAAVEYYTENLEPAGVDALPPDYYYAFHPFMMARGLTVCGRPISDYKIRVEAGDELAAVAADYIRKYVFTHTGETMEYASVNEDPASPELVFHYFSGVGGSTKGYVNVDAQQILILSNETLGFFRLFRDFLNEGTDLPPEPDAGPARITEPAAFVKDYGEFLTYEEFGAAGDGVTDDSQAIYAAHKAAAETGRPILAREYATYYIKTGTNARITTGIDWSVAHFVIDDSELDPGQLSLYLFHVPSSVKTGSLGGTLDTLAAGQAQIDVGGKLPGRALVTVVNDRVLQYIRKGVNQNDGTPMREVILVDGEGNVDPSTPVIWDYAAVTSAYYKPVDEPPLTIRGGIFTTIANRAKSEYNYYNRGIEIQRSQLLIEDVCHYITCEGSTGAPYAGFFMISECCDTTVKNCVITPHKTYWTTGSGGLPSAMGSYECQATSTVGLAWVNVIQSRSINDTAYWGTFASNFSRNILFDGCRLSRFDAHMGVCNVTLRNCHFGHQGVNLIGHGTARLENCAVYGSNLVNLRSDYGSSWNGDLIIRDCYFYPKNGKYANAVLIGGANSFDHDFGYTCYLPRTIDIDGLYIDDRNPGDSERPPMLFADFNSRYDSADYTGAYPLVLPEKIIVSGLRTYSGKPLAMSVNEFMFAGLEIEQRGE